MKKYIFIITFFAFATITWGQSSFEKERQRMQQEYENFRKKNQEKYNNFRDSVFQDYENFRKAVWTEFETFRTDGTFTKPKPKVLPPINPDELPIKPVPVAPTLPKIPKYPKITLPEDDFSKRISSKVKFKLHEIQAQTSRKMTVNFYGATFNFYYTPTPFTLPNLSHQSIANVVKQLGNNTATNEIAQYQWATYAQLMQLNDYGFFQLIKKTASLLYQDKNKMTLYTWYMLTKAGFDAKIGCSEKWGIVLLLPSSVKLSFRNLLYINEKNYYIFDFNTSPPERYGNLYTYKDNPFKAVYQLDFLVSKVPKITEKRKTQHFNFRKMQLASNLSYIDFLSELPTLDYFAYYNMPMSKIATLYLDQQFLPLLKGKTTLEKVTLLLHFVQTSFPYQYDKEQFQQIERPQAPEEMLFYSKGDCEDHAALFAYLVLRYTDCEVLGILYKGHATTAVKFHNSKNEKGWHLPIPYSDYILCEPTCNGKAPVGYIGKEYRGIVPERVFKVTRLNNNYH